jgi:hypothetical protein
LDRYRPDAIHQNKVGKGVDLSKCLPHSFQTGCEDIGAVNLRRTHNTDSNSYSHLTDFATASLPPSRAEELGVTDFREVYLGRQHYRSCHNRAGEGAATNLIHPGNAAKILTLSPALEVPGIPGMVGEER